MVRGLLFALVACTLLLSPLGASPKVPHLNKKNFDDVVSDGKVHFIKYGDWCGHCKRLAPTWAQLREAVKEDDRVSVESVDCTKDRKICDKAKIGGFPTLKIFYKGKAGETFREKRDLSLLQAFLQRNADELTVVKSE